MDKSKSRATKPGVTRSSRVGCTLTVVKPDAKPPKSRHLPVGTVIGSELLAHVGVRRAIMAVLPDHGSLQKTITGDFEVADLRWPGGVR